jgi:hypothetical protein
VAVTYYQRAIAPLAPGYDPRHIEAYMRLAHSTLSGLSDRQFRAEVRLCKRCIDEAGKDAAERCALSFGL